MNEDYGIHWFRRDLRISGNAALEWNLKNHNGRVLGFFCFDPIFLSRSDFSPNRFSFFLDTLKALREELKEKGGDLLVLDHGPAEAFTSLFKSLKTEKRKLPVAVSFNRDYEPFAVIRDTTLKNIFESFNIEVKTFSDHLILEPHENLKKDGSFYQVYSPFAKLWFEKLKTTGLQHRISCSSRSTGDFKIKWKELWQSKAPFEDKLEYYRDTNAKNITVDIPTAGTLAAAKTLESFKKRLEEYPTSRDIPSVNGTSHLSIFLKNGSITTAQIIDKLKLGKAEYNATDGKTKYLKELVWREFYYHILFHCPNVEKESFLEKYRKIKWQNSEKLFKAWCLGQTGYPIVDAGMRQLNQTGWMHNRVRMIVASFLTKDLLIDYRWGENYFMKMLLDGDLAPNNGGWQWAASTGCDPQPYFRIFNPTLQSQKFDPSGTYIKKYVPELASLSSKLIHLPQKPIVDHSVQRDKALALYKKARE